MRVVRIYMYESDSQTYEQASGGALCRVFGARRGRALRAVGSEHFALICTVQ